VKEKINREIALIHITAYRVRAAKLRTEEEEIFGYRIWFPRFPSAIRFSFHFFSVGPMSAKSH
jgi:hypothetical protein